MRRGHHVTYVNRSQEDCSAPSTKADINIAIATVLALPAIWGVPGTARAGC